MMMAVVLDLMAIIGKRNRLEPIHPMFQILNGTAKKTNRSNWTKMHWRIFFSISFTGNEILIGSGVLQRPEMISNDQKKYMESNSIAKWKLERKKGRNYFNRKLIRNFPINTTNLLFEFSHVSFHLNNKKNLNWLLFEG